MDSAVVLYAFGAGALAAFNPCGFVLLPTYAAAFLVEGPDTGTARKVLRTALRMSAGFMLVFLMAGLAVATMGSSLPQAASDPLLTVIAMLLLLTGALLVAGVHVPGINISLGSTRTAFSYGIAYASASLACALPVFLSSVVFAFGRSGGFLSGALASISYSIGMSVSVLVVLLAAASARPALIARMRSSTAHFSRIAGLLMLLAGSALAARQFAGFELLDSASAAVQSGLDGRLWLLPVALSLMVLAALIRRRRGSSG